MCAGVYAMEEFKIHFESRGRRPRLSDDGHVGWARQIFDITVFVLGFYECAWMGGEVDGVKK